MFEPLVEWMLGLDPKSMNGDGGFSGWKEASVTRIPSYLPMRDQPTSRTFYSGGVHPARSNAGRAKRSPSICHIASGHVVLLDGPPQNTRGRTVVPRRRYDETTNNRLAGHFRAPHVRPSP